MRIFGLDPGYGRLGYGVIEEKKAIGFGVITTPKEGTTGERLAEIARDVRSLLTKYQPNRIVIEELFFAKSVTTALKVAEVRGVLLLLAEEFGAQVVEVKPNEVKLALTGYGKADKKQMIDMVRTVFALKTSPKIDDAADALAIAWTGSGKRI
jgi:crossover junction endodeoxyribonuclease RuvC